MVGAAYLTGQGKRDKFVQLGGTLYYEQQIELYESIYDRLIRRENEIT